MAVGFPTNKADVDSRAGFLVLTLRDTFVGIDTLNTWLLNHNDAALTAMGYSAEDIATLRGAFGALSSLGKIAHAQGTQANANDFFFDAKNLTGLS